MTRLVHPELCPFGVSRYIVIVSLISRYIGLHVAYYNRDNILVTHPLWTASHYLCTGFFFDLLCCFPFEAITFFIQQDRKRESPTSYNTHANVNHLRRITHGQKLVTYFIQHKRQGKSPTSFNTDAKVTRLLHRA